MIADRLETRQEFWFVSYHGNSVHDIAGLVKGGIPIKESLKNLSRL